MKAVIDIGTNSVLLLVAERTAAGDLVIHRDEARLTRLGQGAAASGRLASEAIDRTIEALSAYRSLAVGVELVPIATEGVRMAANGEEFLTRAHACLSVPVRVISGDEEARLSYLSVARESPPGMLRVLDIGGGSTELAIGDGETILSYQSHKIGSVRLTERFVDSDPPSASAIAQIEATVLAAFAEQPIEPFPVLHGLAGTVTTAAALLLGLRVYDRDLVDGTRWSDTQVRELRDRLAAQTVEERVKAYGLAPGRADVIPTGVTILLLAMQHCGADTLVVRDRGLRYALI